MITPTRSVCYAWVTMPDDHYRIMIASPRRFLCKGKSGGLMLGWDDIDRIIVREELI